MGAKWPTKGKFESRGSAMLGVKGKVCAAEVSSRRISNAQCEGVSYLGPRVKHDSQGVFMRKHGFSQTAKRL